MRAIAILRVGQALALAAFFAPGAFAQDPPQQVEATQQLTRAELDQMVAPIALYPDPLIGQILMAATYPLEVVEADRWLKEPGNAALKDDQLATALEQKNWDPSIKSLVSIPQILQMMDDNLDWTERLGEAFAADQAAVMDSVQRLRRKAEAAGRLRSSPDEGVVMLGPAITIEPPTPETVYVPVYDPWTAYGPWPYPDYPPDYFPGLIGGFIAVAAPFRGLNHCDWEHHRIDIDRDRWERLNHGRPPVLGEGGGWLRDPSRHADAVHLAFHHQPMATMSLPRPSVVVIRPQVTPQYPHLQPAVPHGDMRLQPEHVPAIRPLAATPRPASKPAVQPAPIIGGAAGR